MKASTKTFVATVRGALPKRVSVYAANASFFLTLSMFPLILLVLIILALTFTYIKEKKEGRI